MKTMISLLFFIILSSSCRICSKHDRNNPKSTWLEKRIEGARTDGYLSVDSYRYQGDTVYLFLPPCCDRFAELYDKNGKLICHPSGGITGKGDGKCTDFLKKAEKINTLYDIDNEKR